MDLGISGRVAMVAASSKGIGLAVAKALAAEGCRLSICARDEETLENAAAEVGEDTRSYVVDVSNQEDIAWWVEQTRQDLGPADIVVTNTGGPPAGALGEISDEQWQLGFDTTLMNVVRLVRLVEPDMRRSGWGRIIHITSYVAVKPSPLLPISSTLRSGLMSLTKLQAAEFAGNGVTVNSVLPGHTLTDRQRHLASIRAGKEGVSEAVALERQGADVPVGRLADPAEIAAAVAFLSSRHAAYITGVSLVVDGGSSLCVG